MTQPITPVFDGHNDVLMKLWLSNLDPVDSFLNGMDSGQLDLPRMNKGGFIGGLFAIYVPSEHFEPGQTPTTPDFMQSQEVTVGMASLLLRIEAASKGRVKICRSAREIRRAMADNALAVVMHIEGAEGIDPDFHMLDVLYAAGLRSLGPLWSRKNIFGEGVPFKFPSSPDLGNGLTELGCRLVSACNKRKIMVDVAHLDEKGFWQVAEISNAPLVATHSNVNVLCAQSRNLTDRQLDAIRESKGFVGVNFGSRFLRADGIAHPDSTLDEVVRHIDYLIEYIGEDCVGFGSDFDGTIMCEALKDVTGLPSLIEALRKHGYSQPLLNKICHENWINVLEKTWGE